MSIRLNGKLETRLEDILTAVLADGGGSTWFTFPANGGRVDVEASALTRALAAHLKVVALADPTGVLDESDVAAEGGSKSTRPELGVLGPDEIKMGFAAFDTDADADPDGSALGRVGSTTTSSAAAASDDGLEAGGNEDGGCGLVGACLGRRRRGSERVDGRDCDKLVLVLVLGI